MPFDLPMDSRLPLGAMGLGADTHIIPVSTSIAEIAGAIYCFFIACSCFLGSWLQTPRWYKYTKSVEPLFAYSQNRGTGKTLQQE